MNHPHTYGNFMKCIYLQHADKVNKTQITLTK